MGYGQKVKKWFFEEEDDEDDVYEDVQIDNEEEAVKLSLIHIYYLNLFLS